MPPIADNYELIFLFNTLSKSFESFDAGSKSKLYFMESRSCIFDFYLFGFLRCSMYNMGIINIKESNQNIEAMILYLE